jgi:hypothetical protein
MGFGYGIQPSLLYEMARCANGSFGHIPDGGMIATVFCNYIATILSTVVMNLQLHIITPNVLIMGDYNYNFDSSKNISTFDLGTVQRQQTRDIVFDLSQRNENEMSRSIGILYLIYHKEMKMKCQDPLNIILHIKLEVYHTLLINMK